MRTYRSGGNVPLLAVSKIAVLFLHNWFIFTLQTFTHSKITTLYSLWSAAALGCKNTAVNKIAKNPSGSLYSSSGNKVHNKQQK